MSCQPGWQRGHHRGDVEAHRTLEHSLQMRKSLHLSEIHLYRLEVRISAKRYSLVAEVRTQSIIAPLHILQ